MNTVPIPRRAHVHIWKPWRLVAGLTPAGDRQVQAWEFCTCGRKRQAVTR